MADNDNEDTEARELARQRQYVTDVHALRARIDALIAATAALAATIDQVSQTPAVPPRDQRSQLTALVDLIAVANGCVSDAIEFVQRRLSTMPWP